MLTYESVPVGHEIYERLERLISANHPDLAGAKVTINAIFAYGGLKLHGYPCLATIKVNSLKDRVEGKSDATLSIDGDSYQGWSDESTDAILDHEANHLIVCREEDGGAFALDDHGRPKLKIRLHDMIVGGFAVIAERHGEASVEVQQAAEIRTKYGQLLWDFAEEHGRRGRKPEAAPESDVIRDTFASLLSVGHTESQARAAIDRAIADGSVARCKDVSSLIDAIYRSQSEAESESEPGKDTPLVSTVTFKGTDFGVIAEAGAAPRAKPKPRAKAASAV